MTPPQTKIGWRTLFLKLLSLAFISASVQAQIPETVVQLLDVKLSPWPCLNCDTPILIVDFKNTGRKPISVIVFISLGSQPQWGSGYIDYLDAALLPGKSGRWSDQSTIHLSDIRVNSVIFSDGTWMGEDFDPKTNRHIVQEIFDQRRGVAQESAKWRDILQHLDHDDHNAVRQFLAAADAVPGEPGIGTPVIVTAQDAGNSSADTGRRQIQISIKNEADRLREALDQGTHEEIWAHQEINTLRERLFKSATLYEQLAKNAGRVKEEE